MATPPPIAVITCARLAANSLGGNTFVKTGCGISGDNPKVNKINSREAIRALRQLALDEMDMPSKLASMRVQVGLAGIFLALVSPMIAQSVTGKNDWHLTSPNGDVALHVRLAESL